MASLFETLTQTLGGDTLKQIASQVGADEKTTGTAVAAALPTLMSALARNASKDDGASSLHRALEKDHDGSILDNLGGFLGKPEAGPGEGILRHLLGNQRRAVETGLSRSSGLSAESTSKLLTTLAPILLGALGRQQKQEGLDPSKLAGLLGSERKEVERRAPEAMGLAGALLDADGDGDVEIDDIAKKGLGMLGKMFGKG